MKLINLISIESRGRNLKNLSEFVKSVKDTCFVGKAYKNPGGGVSTIVSVNGDILVYRRGKSNICVSLLDLYEAYREFIGGRLDSRRLKQFNPRVFDSQARPAGHSCNCTMLMMILSDMKFAGLIEGKGIRGNPFHTLLFPPE